MIDTTQSDLPINLHDDAMQAICRQYGAQQLALFGSVLRETLRITTILMCSAL